MRPLKQPDGNSIVDPLLVDEMFYQIPEILEHHEQFLEQVAGCVSQWHDRQTVGHLLIHSVSRNKSTYLSIPLVTLVSKVGVGTPLRVAYMMAIKIILRKNKINKYQVPKIAMRINRFNAVKHI